MGQAEQAVRANDFMGVPRPVVALARDLPPSHEIDWHSHPRFQLVYAARGVMTVGYAGSDMGGAAAARGVDAAEGASTASWPRAWSSCAASTSAEAAARMPRLRSARGHAAPARADLRATELPLEYDRAARRAA